jgi:TRAP-type C4-dicarboxylate transport system substrate-binding protein
LITNQLFKSLPPDCQQALLDSGKLAHQKALELVESEEIAAYNELKTRGIKEIDTTPHAAEWQKAYADLRAHLTGRLFSAELLDRVTKAAASARK